MKSEEYMESKDIVATNIFNDDGKIRCKIREYQYQEIEDILDLISGKINVNDITIQLIVFYLENHRHKYSKVARYINKKAINDEQIISFLTVNIKRMEEYCKKNSSMVQEHINIAINEMQIEDEYSTKFDNDILIENLEKLKDHINLEQQRIIFSQEREGNIFSGLLDNINSINEVARSDIESKTEEVKRELKEAKQQLNSSVISILGIFCAVVMVFFGGLNVLGNILATMNNSSSIRVVFMAAIVGVIVFNIIFMLLYFIAKVLDKSIATNDLSKLLYKCYVWNEEESRTIENSKAVKKYRKVLESPVLRLRYRYPLIYWFNIFMIFIMSSCIFMWGLRKLGI